MKYTPYKQVLNEEQTVKLARLNQLAEYLRTQKKDNAFLSDEESDKRYEAKKEYNTLHDYFENLHILILKDISKRFYAVDMVKKCSRCSGTGNYSYNHHDGNMCKQCRGYGVVEVLKRYQITNWITTYETDDDKDLIPLIKKLAKHDEEVDNIGYFAAIDRRDSKRTDYVCKDGVWKKKVLEQVNEIIL